MYFLQSQERSLEVNADENSIGINGQEQETVFKDKGMLFTSMITPVILIVLYATFLAKVFKDSFTAAISDMITIRISLLMEPWQHN